MTLPAEFGRKSDNLAVLPRLPALNVLHRLREAFLKGIDYPTVVIEVPDPTRRPNDFLRLPFIIVDDSAEHALRGVREIRDRVFARNQPFCQAARNPQRLAFMWEKIVTNRQRHEGIPNEIAGHSAPGHRSPSKLSASYAPPATAPSYIPDAISKHAHYSIIRRMRF